MPNFWSTTNQKLYEVFYGPKTIDHEFDHKVEEIKKSEKNIHSLQNIISKFHHYHNGLRNYFEDLSNLLENFYDKECVYFSHLIEVSKIHREMLHNYDVYQTNIMKLYQNFNIWAARVEEMLESIKERDRLRRIYDHYDDKMEKYVLKRNKNLEKSHVESEKFIEGFERNNLKYKVATQNYITQSKLTYKLMCSFLDLRNRLMNPLINELIQHEINFFGGVTNQLNTIQDVGERMHMMDENSYMNQYNLYDPTKYIRGRNIFTPEILTPAYPLDFPHENNVPVLQEQYRTSYIEPVHQEIRPSPEINQHVITYQNIESQPELKQDKFLLEKDLNLQRIASYENITPKTPHSTPIIQEDNVETVFADYNKPIVKLQDDIITSENNYNRVQNVENDHNVPIQFNTQLSKNNQNLIESQQFIERDKPNIKNETNLVKEITELNLESSNIPLIQPEVNLENDVNNLNRNLPKNILINSEVNLREKESYLNLENPYIPLTQPEINFKNVGNDLNVNLPDSSLNKLEQNLDNVGNDLNLNLPKTTLIKPEVNLEYDENYLTMNFPVRSSNEPERNLQKNEYDLNINHQEKSFSQPELNLENDVNYLNMKLLKESSTKPEMILDEKECVIINPAIKFDENKIIEKLPNVNLEQPAVSDIRDSKINMDEVKEFIDNYSNVSKT